MKDLYSSDVTNYSKSTECSNADSYRSNGRFCRQSPHSIIRSSLRALQTLIPAFRWFILIFLITRRPVMIMFLAT